MNQKIEENKIMSNQQNDLIKEQIEESKTMHTMKHDYRPFACDKCGAIHQQQTNHEGQIYNVKCNNWPCTAGLGDYTTMTFWNGETKEKETRFYAKVGDENKVKMFFKISK